MTASREHGPPVERCNSLGHHSRSARLTGGESYESLGASRLPVPSPLPHELEKRTDSSWLFRPFCCLRGGTDLAAEESAKVAPAFWRGSEIASRSGGNPARFGEKTGGRFADVALGRGNISGHRCGCVVVGDSPAADGHSTWWCSHHVRCRGGSILRFSPMVRTQDQRDQQSLPWLLWRARSGGTSGTAEGARLAGIP